MDDHDKDYQPHNPGLSPQAWDKLHKFLSRMATKYAAELKEANQTLPKDVAN